MSALASIVRAAQAQGLLPADTAVPTVESRPWPVVLLVALGAWLAAIPLLVVVAMLLGDWATEGVGTYAIGALLLCVAVVVLRRPEVPVFLEQLAIPALLSGGGSLAFALGRDLPLQATAATLTALALGVALVIDRPWLRVLLGVAAGGLFCMSLLPDGRDFFSRFGVAAWWLALHGALGVWVLFMGLQRRHLHSGAQARAARVLESVGSGWLLAVLMGLAWLSGMTFLAPGVLGGGLAGQLAREVARHGMGHGMPLQGAMHAASFLLALFAAAQLARAWPSLRQPAGAAAALLLAALALWLPQLGAAYLALTWTLTTGRWRLAGASALAAVWMLGGFYYALQWSLTHKALLLLGAGIGLGVLSWSVLRHAPQSPERHGASLPRIQQALIALSVATTLAVANWAIQDKENLIASGERVLVELAPVDPRSLMQGDFMRLEFNLPDVPATSTTHLLRGQRPYAVGLRDAQGVLRLSRLETPGQALGPGELRVQLTPKDGRWVLVTDAWFFREGEAARWEDARYGEFRVTPDGRALLVGLANAQMQPILP